MIGTRTFTFLGTGTSVGVPMVGCDCEVCLSDDPRNHRYRCSVCISTADGNILIDTTPELRLQLLRERIQRVESVIYTHFHVDHLFGLDDLRPFSRYLEGAMPIYCSHEVEKVIRRVFSYAFPKEPSLVKTYIPQLELNLIDTQPFRVLNQTVIPIALKHDRFNVLGFRIDDIAYCTDVSYIPDESMARLQNLDILVLDALRYKPHPSHFSIQEALDVIEQLKPRHAYLTHMCHEVDHETVNRQLPSNVDLAYDGLKFSF